MFKKASKTGLFAVLLTFLLPLVSLNANPFLENLTWAAHGSIFYFAGDNLEYSYKTPSQEIPKADHAPITASLGISAAWKIMDFLRVEVTEDIYFKNYEYNTELNYAMTCSIENREAFVLGLLTGLQITGFIPISDNGTALRIYAGPAIDIRLVFKAFGLHPELDNDAIEKAQEIRKYFWSDARWFYPVTGIGMDFPVSEKFLAGFDLRVWYPLYRHEELSRMHGWRFGAGLRITPRKKTKVSDTQIEIPIQPQEPPRIDPPDLPATPAAQ